MNFKQNITHIEIHKYILISLPDYPIKGFWNSHIYKT